MITYLLTSWQQYFVLANQRRITIAVSIHILQVHIHWLDNFWVLNIKSMKVELFSRPKHTGTDAGFLDPPHTPL